MPIKKSKKIATGIFISEEFLYFAQLINVKEELVIDKLARVPLPARSFYNGKIKDQDSLSTQLINTLANENFNTSQIVLGFYDNSYLKHIDKVPLVSDFDLREIVEDRVQTAYAFLQEDFAIGYQKLPDEINKVFTDTQEILFAIIEKSKIASMRELFESADITLNAIDLEPLAAIKTISNNRYLDNSEILSIYIGQEFIDFNVLLNGEIILTNTIKKKASELFSSELNQEELIQKLKNFIFSYENQFPKSELSKVIIIYPKEITPLVEKLKTEFPSFEIEQYNLLQSNFTNINQFIKNDITQENINEFIPAIGLALKYFEPYNKTLSLIRVKKQIEPIINPLELIFATIVLVGGCLLSAVITVYLSARLNNINTNINKTKAEIQMYSSGEYLERQKKLQTIMAQILYYEQYRNENIKSQIMEEIGNAISDDITFNTIALDDKKIVKIDGDVMLLSSLYQFYKKMTEIFKDVEITQITNESSWGAEIKKNKFSIQFQWAPKSTTSNEEIATSAIKERISRL